MTPPTIDGISPFFIVQHLDAALAFYRDMLGFAVTFRGQRPAGRASRHESGHLHAVRPTRGASTGGGRATRPAPEPDTHSDFRDGRNGERLRHAWSESAPPVSAPVAVTGGLERAPPTDHRDGARRRRRVRRPQRHVVQGGRPGIRHEPAGCSAPMRRRSTGRQTASWHPGRQISTTRRRRKRRGERTNLA